MTSLRFIPSVLLLGVVVAACSRDEPVRPDPAQIGATGGGGGAVGATGGGGAAAGAPSNDACPEGLPGPSLVRLTTPTGIAYCMDRTEVTQSQYAAFIVAAEADPGLQKNVKGQHPICAAGFPLILTNPGPPDDVYTRCRASLYQPKELPNNPVVCVDHCAARAYCQWAGKELCGAPGGGAVDLAKATDPSASAWSNACTSGGKNETAVREGVASGVCTVVDGHGRGQVAVDAEPACHSDVAPFDGVLGLGGGVLEWEDACDDSGCVVRGAAARQDPNAPTKVIVAEACGGQLGMLTGAQESAGFRCCKPLPVAK